MDARITKVEPPGGAAASRYRNASLLDCYAVLLPERTKINARCIAELTISDQPFVVQILMKLQDSIVARSGVLTSRQMRGVPSDLGRIDYFPIMEESESEVGLGFEDTHLDFKMWFTIDSVNRGLRLRSTTLVRTHDIVGRVYIAIIRPLHVAIVRHALRRTASRLSRRGSTNFR